MIRTDKSENWYIYSTSSLTLNKSGIENVDLLPKPSDFTVCQSSVESSLGELESLACLRHDVKFRHWTFIREGTHSEIYRATEVESGVVCCIKIFRPEWMIPFNLEKAAYEALQRNKIEKYVPHVYAYSYGKLSDLGFPNSLDDEELYYILIIEWLKGAERVSAENITLLTASRLVKGLSLIHHSGILYNDLYLRNIIVIPETERGIWIDFSCAHMDEEYGQHQEMITAVATILEIVKFFFHFADMISRGARQMIRAYALYTSFSRRALAYLFL